MENYLFTLTPANRRIHIDFSNLEKQYSIFSLAVQNCNTGKTFSKSGKKIKIELIESKQIKLTLSSISHLSSPTRSLSAFSREIIRLNESLNCVTNAIYNHTLFQTQLTDTIIESKCIDDINNSELLLAVSELLLSPTKYNSLQGSHTIRQLKEIMLPYIS